MTRTCSAGPVRETARSGSARRGRRRIRFRPGLRCVSAGPSRRVPPSAAGRAAPPRRGVPPGAPVRRIGYIVRSVMPFDDIGERVTEGIRVEITGQPQRNGNVVCRGVGVELVDEPHALLCERQRDPVGSWKRHQRGPGSAAGVLGANAGGQGRDAGRLEQVTDTDARSDRRVDPRDHAGCAQGASPRSKKFASTPRPPVPSTSAKAPRSPTWWGAGRPEFGGRTETAFG